MRIAKLILEVLMQGKEWRYNLLIFMKLVITERKSDYAYTKKIHDGMRRS